MRRVGRRRCYCDNETIKTRPEERWIRYSSVQPNFRFGEIRFGGLVKLWFYPFYRFGSVKFGSVKFGSVKFGSVQ